MQIISILPLRMKVVGFIIPGQLKIIMAIMLAIIPNIAKIVISTPRTMKTTNSSSSFSSGLYMKYVEGDQLLQVGFVWNISGIEETGVKVSLSGFKWYEFEFCWVVDLWLVFLRVEEVGYIVSRITVSRASDSIIEKMRTARIISFFNVWNILCSISYWPMCCWIFSLSSCTQMVNFFLQ